jgi:hypothetical protein
VDLPASIGQRSVTEMVQSLLSVAPINAAVQPTAIGKQKSSTTPRPERGE